MWSLPDGRHLVLRAAPQEPARLRSAADASFPVLMDLEPAGSPPLLSFDWIEERHLGLLRRDRYEVLDLVDGTTRRIADFGGRR